MYLPILHLPRVELHCASCKKNCIVWQGQLLERGLALYRGSANFLCFYTPVSFKIPDTKLLLIETGFVYRLQHNANSKNWQHDKLLFPRFGYSLLIIRNEMMILLHVTEYIRKNIHRKTTSCKLKIRAFKNKTTILRHLNLNQTRHSSFSSQSHHGQQSNSTHS